MNHVVWSLESLPDVPQGPGQSADPEKCRIDIHNFMWERIYFTALWCYNDDSKSMGGFIKAIASRSYNEAR